MVLISLSSSNPKFSFIIRKNPANGMIMTKLRQGFSFGWYATPSQYCIYFSDNGMSYKEHKNTDFEYLNSKRYSSPVCVMNLSSEYLKDPLIKLSEDDSEGFEHSCKLSFIESTDDIVRRFETIIAGIKCSSEKLHTLTEKRACYAITISTQKSLNYLLMLVNLFCLFSTLMIHEHFEISDNLIEKYVHMIAKTDLPFYFRYKFSVFILTSPHVFSKYQTELEKSATATFKLAFGDTGTQRKNGLDKLLSFKYPIVDIGCGEGNYGIPFAKKLGSLSYSGIDCDPSQIKKIVRRAKEKRVTNLNTYLSLDEYLTKANNSKIDVILSEVIEHISVEEAEVLIKQVLDRIDFNSFIITTPDRDFNKHYSLGNNLRISDHKWEMTGAEFSIWIEKIVGNRFKLTPLQIGHAINGVYSTQGVLIIPTN